MAQPGGRELFGASLGVDPQLQPLQGMLLRRSTDIHPKELARDMREFFNSLVDEGGSGDGLSTLASNSLEEKTSPQE